VSNNIVDHCRIRETFTAVILFQSAQNPNRVMMRPHEPAVKTPDGRIQWSIQPNWTL
jgi:hypothetical protein